MSVYLVLLFVGLVLEMSVLFVLVLPLPLRARKLMVSKFEGAMSSTQVKTAGYIVYGLVGLLFLDSWKRANSAASRNRVDRDLMISTSHSTLVAQAYHQRNLYISGFILYFSISIPMVMYLLRSYVHQAELENVPGDVPPVIKELQEELRKKELSLQALKQQNCNLESHFDKVNAPPSEADASKKDE